jgi:hypothetical protein
MLVAKAGPPAQSWAHATYSSDVSVALILSASESAPASPIRLPPRLQRESRVRDARGETGPPAQSRARARLTSASRCS